MNRTRPGKGQSLVELCAALAILVPIVLLCVDVGTIYMGVTLNQTACRDAARAASIGPPSAITLGEPKRRAEAVLTKSYITPGAVRIRPTVTCNENIRGALPTAPYGGPVDGQVTVETTVDIYPPFILQIFAGQQGWQFTTNHSFPYTWVMPQT